MSESRHSKNVSSPAEEDKTVSLAESFLELGTSNKIRQTYRVQVAEGEHIKVIINDIEYEVVDIASKGVGLRITKLDKFSVGEIVKPIRMVLHNKTFRLTGKIVHVTSEGPETSLCGVEFVNLTDESRAVLLDYLKNNSAFDLDTVF